MPESVSMCVCRFSGVALLNDINIEPLTSLLNLQPSLATNQHACQTLLQAFAALATCLGNSMQHETIDDPMAARVLGIQDCTVPYPLHR